MSDKLTNLDGDMYNSYLKIIKSITIKYSSKAEELETLESKSSADAYFDALYKKDTFFTYIDYTYSDYTSVGITDKQEILSYLNGNTRDVPIRYHQQLLEIRRNRILNTFEEQNDYYRTLNGFPKVKDRFYFHASPYVCSEYGVDPEIPIHLIQDYYNKETPGRGDYFMSVMEGMGYIDALYEANPDKEYLKYLGSNRIDLYTARQAKNFQIIQVRKPPVNQSLLTAFLSTYEQCREYFMKTIYMSGYKLFIDHYDNFIGLCIMLMTTQQLVMRKVMMGVKRDFFDIFAIKALYEAYDIPYNLNIDEETQSDLVQNINMLIQNKATDKVIYNIAYLLGYTNINVYKYYLTKEHKKDIYDVPIFKYRERFNTDTGQMETEPDYENMYDVYFQKEELKNLDYSKSFYDKSNRVEYEEVTGNDPYWWTDEKLYELVWNAEYNSVESKYLGLGISYSMTEIMFENIILIKMLLQKEEMLQGVSLKLPRILENTNIPLFDVILALVCLTSCRHNLFGEIITVPTQVIGVLDYLKNQDGRDTNLDTLHFNFNYFFNPDVYDDNEEVSNMRNQLIEHMNNQDKDDLTVDTLNFNFDYFSLENPKREEHLSKIKEILGEKEYKEFLSYVDKISHDIKGSPNQAITHFNEMFKSIKNLHKLIRFQMTKTDKRYVYDTLKQLNDALYYSKEMTDTFTITGEITGRKRTAWTYFEFLRYKNPKLYNALFTVDMNSEYNKYISEHGLEKQQFSMNQFLKEVEYGNIFIDYGTLKEERLNDESVKEEKIYAYVQHIVSRLELVIEDVKSLYLLTDIASPLETLLIKLVRFFKSYTVDIVGLSTIFVCDFKPENTIKLFDEIWRITKLIQTREDVNLSYGDLINTITSVLRCRSDIFLRDQLKHEVTLLLDKLCNPPSIIELYDQVYSLVKIIRLTERSLLNLNDTIHVQTTINPDDGFGLSDKAIKIYYD